MSASPDIKPLIMTRGLTKSFRSLVALNDHAIAIYPGEIIGVIGPNGSGKSTLFNLISGFLQPNAGEIVFDGAPIIRQSAEKIVRLGIARTFQGTRLFPMLSVADNVRVAAELRHRTGIFAALVGGARRRRAEGAIEEITAELLDLVGLTGRGDDRARDLPYGDQRRLEIIRALATRPRLLLLDEPAAGMDASETRVLMALIKDIRDRYGLTVIVVEHDMDLIMNLCERIQVLAYGDRVFEGSPEQVQVDPGVREVYLGHG